MRDEGWETVYPKPLPVSGEVELFGGPRDGERRYVADIVAPLRFDVLIKPPPAGSDTPQTEFAEVPTGRYVYHRREGAERRPIPFDFTVEAVPVSA